MSITSAGSQLPISATAPAQKTLPITAASASSDLRCAERVSRRAAMSAWMESGSGIRASDRSCHAPFSRTRRS